MANRRRSRATSVDPATQPIEKPPVAPGTSREAAGPSGTDLPLPSERDQAFGHTGSTPDPAIRQAGKDLDAGLVDTDMRATPGLDAQRRERLAGPPPPRRKP